MKNWKNLCRRGLSLLVCFVMCLSMLPGVAYAKEGDDCRRAGCNGVLVAVPETPATCTEGTIKAHLTCSICGTNYHRGSWSFMYLGPVDRISDPLGHDMTYHAATEATCTIPGNVEYWSCSRCGKNFSDQAGNTEITNPTGTTNPDNHTGEQVREHDDAGHWTEWNCCHVMVGSKEAHTYIGADCVTEGACNVCGAKGIDSNAHVPSEAVRENVVEATCVTEGSYDEVVYCSKCGEELSREKKTIDRLTTHTPAAAVRENEVAATCTKGGSYDEVVYCSVCGEELSREAKTTEANGHSYTGPTWDWYTRDYGPEAGARFGCANCKNAWYLFVREEATENGYVTVENNTATCGKGGKADCVATVYFNGETYTDARKVSTPPTKDHTPGETTTQKGSAPTCTKDGYHYEITKCSECGQQITRKRVTDPKLGHDFSEEWVSDTARHWHKCTRCKVTQDRGPHTLVIDEAVAPTCITAGKTEGKHCSVCEKVIVAQEVIPATGIHNWGDWTANGTGHTHTCKDCNKTETLNHDLGEWTTVATAHKEKATCGTCGYVVWHDLDHQWDEGTVTVEATCVKDGTRTYKCVWCTETKTEVIPATGKHVPGEPVVTPATCEASGTKITSCKDCHTVLTTEVLSKLGHNYDAGVVTTSATCTEKGVKTYTCQREGCNDSYTEEIPMVAHTLISVAEDPATCTKDGMAAHSKCEVCGNLFTGSGTSLKETTEADLVIKQLGHNTEGAVEHKDATCTEDGVVGGTYCTRCGEGKEAAEKIIPMTGHAWGEWTITAEPTTETTGTARRVCANDEDHVETVEIPRLPTSENPSNVWKLNEEASEAPNCTEDGKNVYTSEYGEVEVVVPALGHDFAEAWTAGDDSHWHVCTRCEDAIDGAAAHDYDDGEVTLAPTATAEGTRIFTCQTCGATRTEAIPATGTVTPPTPPTPAPAPGTGGGTGGTPTPTPGGDVNIDEEDVPLADITFEDVLPTDPFYEAVKYVFNRGLMEGVSDTEFAPQATLNRAMLVTILYRLEGEPEAEPSTFKDVPAGKWFTDAVGWAAANEVVEGYDDDHFGPLDPLTREQMAAILYRYAKYKGYDVTDAADLTAYTDADAIHEYALDAATWSVAISVLEALTETTLGPRDNATRAQVAVALMNFCEKYVPLETEGEAA